MIRFLNVYYPTRTIILLLTEACAVCGCFLAATWIMLGPDAFIALEYQQGLLKIALITLLFYLAAVANTYVHTFQAFYPNLKHLGVIGLTVTLFLIGTGLSKKTLQEVGVRPLLQGILLWIVVAVGSLALIRGGWIHL